MKTRTLFAAPVVALMLGLGSAAAMAAPLGILADAGTDEGLVQKTAGCHRSCEWGPVLGWHRHVGPYCRPVGCAPLALYPGRCWVDGWGVRRCRW